MKNRYRKIQFGWLKLVMTTFIFPHWNSVQWKVLECYPNLELRHVPLDTLFSVSSPLHLLWTSGRVKNSMWPISHTSDIVRFMLLYKYGGTWLDTDVIRKLHEMVNGFLF